MTAPARLGRSTERFSPKLSVVLATLNEQANLPVLVDAIRSQPLPSCEIIIVDDGSTDGTREYVSLLAGKDSSIRPIFNNGPQTLTPAQCQGVAEARGEFVVIMDSDLQHPPELLPGLLRLLEDGNDLVVATRYGVGGSVGSRPCTRALLSRGAGALAKALVPAARRVSDPVSGFFAFRRDVFFPINRRYRGYKLLLFVLNMCKSRRITELPYHFRARANGHSKITQDLTFMKVFLTEALLARRDETRIAVPAPTPTPVPTPMLDAGFVETRRATSAHTNLARRPSEPSLSSLAEPALDRAGPGAFSR